MARSFASARTNDERNAERRTIPRCRRAVPARDSPGAGHGPRRGRTTHARRSTHPASTDGLHRAEPSASFHPPFEGRQHALRPDCRFGPGPAGPVLSRVSSPAGHCRGGLVRRPGLHASTFLHPFAPRELPRFLATMGALRPGRLPATAQVSLLHVDGLPPASSISCRPGRPKHRSPTRQSRRRAKAAMATARRYGDGALESLCHQEICVSGWKACATGGQSLRGCPVE